MLPRTPVPLFARILRAVLYGASVFVSFFLMLVFMTYNVCLPYPLYRPLPHFSMTALENRATDFTDFLVLWDFQAYLILAVVLGASIGHFVFGAYMDVDGVLAGAGAGKGMACH